MSNSVIKEILPHRIAVARYPHELAIESPPRAGQMMRDSPKTAPFIQNTFVRSDGFDISARIACATDTFHPVIPSKTRDKNIITIGSESIPKI